MQNFTGLNIKAYTLSSLTNPTNSTTPQQYFWEESTLPVTLNQHHEYAYDLTESILNVNKNVFFPWPSYQTYHSIMADQFRYIQHNNTIGESSTLFYIHRSYKTIIYESNYMTLLDAFAFVGGIFQFIMGVFLLFMTPLTRMFY
jgi:hypothetical protein